MSKLVIDNYCGRMVEPFELMTMPDGRTSCRFCESTFRAKAGREHKHTAEDKRSYRIPAGAKAIRMIVFTGPVGTGYLCLKCAQGLVENLQRELDKAKRTSNPHESVFNSGDLINAMMGGNRIPQRGKL